MPVRLLSLLFCVPAVALAAPSTLTHQGRLLGADGTPLEGAQSLTFSLYAGESGGDALWTETDSVEVSGGYFVATLGDGAALPPQIATADALWLGIAVEGAELPSRRRVDAVPYALHATSAGSAASVPFAGVSDLPAGLSDGDNDSFAALTCDTAGRVLTWDGTAFACAVPALPTAEEIGAIAAPECADGAPVIATTDGFGCGEFPEGATLEELGGLPLAGGTVTGALGVNGALLPPRVASSGRATLAGLAAGTVIYNTDTKALEVYDGANWISLAPATQNAYGSVGAFRRDGGYAYFDLDEPAGNRAYDAVSNRFVEGPAPIVAGASGNARRFNGGGQTMKGTIGYLTGNANHTFVITFKIEALQTGSFSAIASLGNTEENSRSHAPAISTANKLGGGFYGDDYWDALGGPQQALTLNTWVQGIWSYNATTNEVTVYRNGVKVATTRGSAGNVAKNFTDSFNIGGWVHTPGFLNNTYAGEAPENLVVDEVALYGRAIADADAARIYAASLGANRPIVAR